MIYVFTNSTWDFIKYSEKKYMFVFFILYLTILCIFHKPFLVIIKIKYGKCNLVSVNLYKATLKTELRSISILCCV